MQCCVVFSGDKASATTAGDDEDDDDDDAADDDDDDDEDGNVPAAKRLRTKAKEALLRRQERAVRERETALVSGQALAPEQVLQ